MAAAAQEYAEGCPDDHSGTSYGENLYWSWSSSAPSSLDKFVSVKFYRDTRHSGSINTFRELLHQIPGKASSKSTDGHPLFSMKPVLLLESDMLLKWLGLKLARSDAELKIVEKMRTRKTCTKLQWSANTIPRKLYFSVI